jgi:hypothetical protein
MINLRNYYENEMGWSAGPHAFVDGVSIWVFTDFNVKGVHSPSWNGTRLGIEMVGDYDTESDETGLGAKVMKDTVALFGECHMFFGWEPNNDKIKLHKEDPNTDHDCPGSNIVKAEFLDDVTVYMGDGGDHGPTPPTQPRNGTVGGVASGDRLNLRATASSSAAIVGYADNGDVFRILAEAYNGSTKWYRVETSTGEGPSAEAFAWAAAQYITLAPIEGVPPVAEAEWNENITATVFGGPGDEQETAYGGWVDSSTKGVALPFKWKGTRPKVTVSGPRGEYTTDIVDLGPWNTNDPNYVNGDRRPMVEKQYQMGLEAQNGQVPTNDAAIDLTVPVADAVGIDGKGKVKWKFSEPQTS